MIFVLLATCCVLAAVCIYTWLDREYWMRRADFLADRLAETEIEAQAQSLAHDITLSALLDKQVEIPIRGDDEWKN